MVYAKAQQIPNLTEKVLNDVTKPILFVGILALVFAYFSDAISQMDVVLQFVIVGLPLSFLVFYYFGKQHDGWMYIASLFTAALAWDLVLPPYTVGLDGVFSTQALLSGTSIDTFVGTIWSGLGVNGFLLFFLTYPVSFAILFTLATVLFKMAHKK
jgi:uncharacterized membrane protein